jgi:methionyl-tRNA formyltransferase
VKLFKKNAFPKNFLFVSNLTELNKKLKKINPKYIFFIHWHDFIPKKIYSKFECIGFHMTDLPYGRGGSPLQNLIIRKNKVTKVSAFKINNTLDAGPIYIKRTLSLTGTALQIYQRLTLLSFKMIKIIISKDIIPIKQMGKPILFKRRNPEQSLIKNNINLDEIYDFIRMLDAPDYPKAYLDLKYIKIHFSNVQKIQGKLKAKIEISKK